MPCCATLAVGVEFDIIRGRDAAIASAATATVAAAVVGARTLSSAVLGRRGARGVVAVVAAVGGHIAVTTTTAAAAGAGKRRPATQQLGTATAAATATRPAHGARVASGAAAAYPAWAAAARISVHAADTATANKRGQGDVLIDFVLAADVPAAAALAGVDRSRVEAAATAATAPELGSKSHGACWRNRPGTRTGNDQGAVDVEVPGGPAIDCRAEREDALHAGGRDGQGVVLPRRAGRRYAGQANRLDFRRAVAECHRARAAGRNGNAGGCVAGDGTAQILERGPVPASRPADVQHRDGARLTLADSYQAEVECRLGPAGAGRRHANGHGVGRLAGLAAIRRLDLDVGRPGHRRRAADNPGAGIEREPSRQRPGGDRPGHRRGGVGAIAGNRQQWFQVIAVGVADSTARQRDGRQVDDDVERDHLVDLFALEALERRARSQRPCAASGRGAADAAIRGQVQAGRQSAGHDVPGDATTNRLTVHLQQWRKIERIRRANEGLWRRRGVERYGQAGDGDLVGLLADLGHVRRADGKRPGAAGAGHAGDYAGAGVERQPGRQGATRDGPLHAIAGVIAIACHQQVLLEVIRIGRAAQYRRQRALAQVDLDGRARHRLARDRNDDVVIRRRCRDGLRAGGGNERCQQGFFHEDDAPAIDLSQV